MKLKREITDKNEQDLRVIELVMQYFHTTSTICSILKQKVINIAKGGKIISKLLNSP